MYHFFRQNTEWKKKREKERNEAETENLKGWWWKVINVGSDQCCKFCAFYFTLATAWLYLVVAVGEKFTSRSESPVEMRMKENNDTILSVLNFHLHTMETLIDFRQFHYWSGCCLPASFLIIVREFNHIFTKYQSEWGIFFFSSCTTLLAYLYFLLDLLICRIFRTSCLNKLFKRQCFSSMWFYFRPKFGVYLLPFWGNLFEIFKHAPKLAW